MLDSILNIGTKLIDRLIPDKLEASKAKLELVRLEQAGELAEIALDGAKAEALASIVDSESKSESWLTRNYRPIIYLTLLFFASARIFGYGNINVTPAEHIMIWKIIEFGLTLGIGSRGIEKVSNSLKDVLKR